MSDPVNHPQHYTQGGIECIQAIEAALTAEEFRGYCKGNALKYVWRERHKGGAESLAKAGWYLNRLGESAPASSAPHDSRPYQSRVGDWMLACFGYGISTDRAERNHRFLEEALELVQACGCSASEAHQLVDYTFGRPLGEIEQEVGGVMVTLAALCLANEVAMAGAGEIELTRVWTKIDAIRAKQAAKPKYSPLPQRPVEATP